MLTPSHSLQTCGIPEVIASTTIVRNVVENQLRKAGVPHPENPNWPPLIRKSKIFSCHDLAIWESPSYWFDVSFPLLSELPSKADEPLQPLGLLSEFSSPR